MPKAARSSSARTSGGRGRRFRLQHSFNDAHGPAAVLGTLDGHRSNPVWTPAAI